METKDRFYWDGSERHVQYILVFAFISMDVVGFNGHFALFVLMALNPFHYHGTNNSLLLTQN